ncbi:DEAD/DEAH box helicase, partial [Salmonella enterica subsp. enterica serovar Virginia]|nr:DEAD/DEAH box helicase [Salmonella enterica subsp. enterica serovar Virginia]
MLEEALKKYFHYDTFRPGQREVIEAVLQEKDVIALLPTGSGKSLCYQLSGYLLNGTVV